MDWPEHGAMPDAFMKKINQPVPENMTDFSVNTNPLGAPAALLAELPGWAADVEHYPDYRYKELIKDLAAWNNVEESCIHPGNGASELIYITASLFSEKKALIIEPAFSEYRKALEAYRCEVQSFLTTEEDSWEVDLSAFYQALDEVESVWICNPNNPTGTAQSRQTMTAMINACEKRGIYVIIDEAFFDFQADPVTYGTEAARLNGHVIVIRSLTKMYAIPGIRAGYALAPPSFIEKMQERTPSWNIGSTAEKAMRFAASLEPFRQKTAQFIQTERSRLLPLLKEAGFTVSPSNVNYYLIRRSDEGPMLPVLKKAAEYGFMLRHTYSFQGLEGNYIRIAVKQKTDNDRLVHMLREVMPLC
ncbi:L-threonine O-3-phosphate decarboxylase [Sinobaca qinghaiensis]|uniref:Aminotransferase n=1 Tax=Sinobaca qinghaiensis TaxID=342944 RepID=A0A419V2Y9_9BACL|nr:aminotransferase class I/II-fold pyridoxal phosphate-dependent enzyme [Sinobaca qinghaiensis]RKD72893.1 L-threonine O-3-phosphate decarboxylase [Sinobaca qinghaiensis]